MENNQLISLIKKPFFILVFLFSFMSYAESYYTDTPIMIENISESKLFFISLGEIDPEHDSRKCDCIVKPSKRNSVIFGYGISNRIVGPVIGVAGAFIVAIITLSVYHTPFFVSIRVKAEVKQRMEAENALEVFKALGKFYLEVGNMTSIIKTLSELMIARHKGEELSVIGRKELNKAAKSLKSTDDIREMSGIAHNTITENSKPMIEITNYLVALFQADEIIYGKIELSEEIAKRVSDISFKVQSAFKFDENLPDGNAIEQIVIMARGKQQKEVEAKIGQLIKEIKDIYKERLT